MHLSKKQEQPRMSEQEYRAVELDSYSSLKVYADSPMKFYRTYVTKEIKRDPVGKDGITGALVHSLLERNDGTIDEDKFLQAIVGEIDKGKATQIELFALKVWEIMEACVDSEGNQTRQFSSIAEEAFNAVKYDRNGEEVMFKKKELSYAIEKFSGSKTEMWLNQKRNAYGKTLVSVDDIANAEKIVEILKSYKDTSWIYTQQSNNRYDVYNELQVFFHYEGIDLKMMADKVIVDKEEWTITSYDTKVTWDESFVKQYLDNDYYLQGVVYNEGLKAWAIQQGMEKYKVIPMQFIRAHSLCWYNPLVFPMTDKDLQKANEGFYLKSGRYYQGLREIVENLQYSLETGNWKSTKKQDQNNSIQPLNIQYQ